MVKFIKSLIALSILQMALIIVGCGEDVDCGDFPTKFAITDVSITEAKFNDPANLFDAVELSINDTIPFDSLYLNLRATFESFAFRSKGSFINSAYACSPPPLTPVDTVSSIQVLSLRQTGVVSFEVVKDLTDSFDVVSFSDEGGFSNRVPLKIFNMDESVASTSYFLFPTIAPDSIVNIGYQAIITFSNGSTLDVSSKFLYLSP